MYKIPTLPLKQEIETKPVLKQLVEAHKCLAELKGAVKSMPNESILINTPASMRRPHQKRLRVMQMRYGQDFRW